MNDGTESKFLSYLDESRRSFKNGDYINSLIQLEKSFDFANQKKEKEMIKLRILLRELVGDYVRALEDIKNYDISDKVVECVLLAWTGEYKRIQDYILSAIDGSNFNEIDLSKFMGLAGRRIDLLINNIDLEKTPPYDPIDEIENPECVVEHLLALNKCDLLRDIENKIIDSYPKKMVIDKLERYNSLDTLPKEHFDLFKDLTYVNGWLSIDEAWTLFYFSQQVPSKQKIVEIGAWKGKSTISLARGSLSGSKPKVHSIDIHEGLEGISGPTLNTFKDNLKSRDLLNNVEIHKDYSTVVGRSWEEGPIGLLFIDASHEYKDVLNDYLSWKEHLGEESFVLFHDANMKGPNKLIREKILNDSDMEPIGYMDSLFVFKKNTNSRDPSRDDFWDIFLSDREYAYEHWIDSQNNKIRKDIEKIFKDLESDL